MAYEYLNETTEAMFKQINSTGSISASSYGLDIALCFYEHTLNRSKFKSQKWLFQKYLFEWSSAFAYGYFKKSRAQLSPEMKNKMKDLDLRFEKKQ